MDVRHMDHVNLRTPADALDAARAFYEERLGFPLEGVGAFETGEKPFFDVRLAPTAVIHLWPSDDFEPPTGANYRHACVVVEQPIEDVKEELDDVGVEVVMELDSPRGATGVGPAVYVADPFGYRLEIKADA